MQTRKKSLVRHLTAVILCLVLTLTTLQMTVWAVDLSSNNSLNVSTNGAVFEYTNDLTEEGNVQVDLYRLATATTVEGMDTYGFFFEPEFAELKLGDSEISELGLETGTVSVSEDQWNQFAQTVSKALMDGSTVQPVSSSTLTASVSFGTASFTGLPAGLYLVVTHGKDEADYWEVQKDDSGADNVVATASSDLYTYSFIPSIIALPTKNSVDGVITTAASNGDWIYDATVSLKASVEPRYGGISIVKNIDEFKGDEEVTFVFQIDATGDFADNHNYHYSNVAAVAFNAATGLSTTAVVDHIRAGAKVTVTEVYTGLKYNPGSISMTTGDGTIVADKTDGVVFTANNTFTDTTTGGHGIQNHFEKTESSWSVEQQDAGNGLNR